MARINSHIFLAILLIVVSGCSIRANSSKSEIGGVYIPKNLDDAISELNNLLNDSTKIEIRNYSEDEFVGRTHFGLGIWMRNNWGLWANSRLYGYFLQKGIKHPDDMSGILLTSYHRSLNKKEIDLKSQIKGYQAYWKEASRIAKLVALPKSKEWPLKKIDYMESIWYFNHESNQNSMVHLLEKKSADSIWIYDYMFGWKKIDKIFKKELKFTNNADSLLHVIFKK